MVRAIVGANWGDEERKNYGYAGEKNPTSSSAFRGGSNAGHTIINNYGKFASPPSAVRCILQPYDERDRATA